MMILCDEPMWSFESLQSLNTQDRFTHFDYVRVLRQCGKIDQQTLINWLKSYSPSLVEHEGRVYLAEQFSDNDFEELRRRVASDSDAQLFMNLVNVTDVLGQEANAPAVAAQIADNVNAQIFAQYPSHLDRAKTLLDGGEHYVSIVRS